MNAAQRAAWLAFEAALDAWMAAPSDVGWTLVDQTWMLFHSL